ncbi:MAG TPA: hypothetical protein ENG35_04235 [Desulfobacteraceae bacterium]|nr:hypothetical protein [Desulfobacteraceae bacterium]
MQKSYQTIFDFITGQEIPDIGAQANRQAVEQMLVYKKGYAKQDIQVDVEISFTIGEELYSSQLDLVVSVDERRFMAIKCAAGSLGSREREIIAASRILEDYQIPVSVVSDGKTAIVMDTVSGKKIGLGLNAIPTKDEAKKRLNINPFQSLPKKRRCKEKLIFRSYDIMNVNVKRNIPKG